MNTKIPTVKACGDFASGRCFEKIDNFNLVTPPGRTWKCFWDSMERMSDRLEALGIDEEIGGRNV